jgi:hypothetical protein
LALERLIENSLDLKFLWKIIHYLYPENHFFFALPFVGAFFVGDAFFFPYPVAFAGAALFSAFDPDALAPLAGAAACLPFPEGFEAFPLAGGVFFLAAGSAFFTSFLIFLDALAFFVGGGGAPPFLTGATFFPVAAAFLVPLAFPLVISVYLLCIFV